MKTFLEYNENNNIDAQIEQLAYNIVELGINPLEILGEMSEGIISKLDNKEDKIKVALIEQEIIEGIGSAIGKMAGGIRNAFSDIGKGYQQSRTDYQNQQGQPVPPVQQGQQPPPAPQQGQQGQEAPQQQGSQANQMYQVIQSFKNSLRQAGFENDFAQEMKAIEQKFIKLGQQQQAQQQAPQSPGGASGQQPQGQPAQAQASPGEGPGFAGQ